MKCERCGLPVKGVELCDEDYDLLCVRCFDAVHPNAEEKRGELYIFLALFLLTAILLVIHFENHHDHEYHERYIGRPESVPQIERTSI